MSHLATNTPRGAAGNPSYNSLGIRVDWKPETKNEIELVKILQSKHDSCTELQAKIQLLENRLVELENSQKQKEIPVQQEQPKQYETDDDQLAEDTEWIRMRNVRNKKRRRNETASPPAPPALKEKIQKEKRPPPIIVDKVESFATLNTNILSVVNDTEYTLKLLKNNGAKLNPSTSDSHRKITEMLNAMKMSWHSFENKQNRPFRVMVKGIHHSWDSAAIIEDLSKQGLKAIEAVNKIGWKSKVPLDMFIVSFHCDEDSKKIQNLKFVLNTRVQVESLRANKLIPQCKKCQGYGHTQKYCARENRCVKCVGKHLTKDCPKSAESKPKCCHCGKEHPANYRGCQIVKDLQKIKMQNNKPKQTRIPEVEKIQEKKLQEKTVNKKSYAQVVQTGQPKPQSNSNSNLIMATLQTILNRLDVFEKKLATLEKPHKGAVPKISKS